MGSSYSHLLPTSPTPRQQLRHITSQTHYMVTTQPPKTLMTMVRQTRPPQQIIRPMRLVQPKQTVKKMIVVKNPGLHFYTDPLATPSDVAVVDTSESPADETDESQFITPDQILE